MYAASPMMTTTAPRRRRVGPRTPGAGHRAAARTSADYRRRCSGRRRVRTTGRTCSGSTSRAAEPDSPRIHWPHRAGCFARRLHQEKSRSTSFRLRRRHRLARTSRDLLPHRPPDRRPKARWHRRSANPDAMQPPHANRHCSGRAPQLSPRRRSRQRHRRRPSAADCQDPARAHCRRHPLRRTSPPPRMPGCSGWRSSQHPRPDPTGSDHDCPHSCKPPLVQLIEPRRAPDRIRRPAPASCRERAPRPALRKAKSTLSAVES